MRFWSGLYIGIFGLVAVLLGGWVFTLAITSLTCLALLELFRMAEFTGIKPATKTTLVACMTIIISTYLEVHGILDVEISNSILPVSSIVICTWLLLQPKPGKIADIATSIFGLFYLGVLPSYWIRLREMDLILDNPSFRTLDLASLDSFSGLNITLITCLLIVSSDIGSYFIGKRYGKNSLSLISPGKTIEGLFGGILCSILTGIIFATFFDFGNPIIFGLIFGTLVSLMGLVGDLIESMMKRDAKLKDSGNLLPGHGGMLDRIDSYIFIPSLIYYFIIIFNYLNLL